MSFLSVFLQMSSNGLESLSDIGQGVTNCQTCLLLPRLPSVSHINCYPHLCLHPPQPTCLVRSVYLLLWPHPSQSAMTRRPPWWPHALTCQRAPAARPCLPCRTLSLCQSTWRNAAAVSSKTSWTVCWSASQRKLVKWVKDRWARNQPVLFWYIHLFEHLGWSFGGKFCSVELKIALCSIFCFFKQMEPEDSCRVYSRSYFNWKPSTWSIV